MLNNPSDNHISNWNRTSIESHVSPAETKSRSRKSKYCIVKSPEPSKTEEKTEDNFLQAVNYMVESQTPRLLNKRDEKELKTISDFCIVNDVTKKIKTFDSSLTGLMSFLQGTYDDVHASFAQNCLSDESKDVNNIQLEEFKWPKSPALRTSKTFTKQKHVCSQKDCQKEYSTKAALLLHVKSKHVSEENSTIKKRKQKNSEVLEFDSLSNLKLKLDSLDPLEDTKPNLNMELDDSKKFLDKEIEETNIINDNLEDQNSLKKSKCSTADATKDFCSKDQDAKLQNDLIGENKNLNNNDFLNKFFEVNNTSNNQFEENEITGGFSWDIYDSYYNDKKIKRDSQLYGLDDDLDSQHVESDFFVQDNMNLNCKENINRPKIQSDNMIALSDPGLLLTCFDTVEPKRKSSFNSQVDNF